MPALIAIAWYLVAVLLLRPQKFFLKGGV